MKWNPMCWLKMCGGTIDSFERDTMDRIEWGVVWTCVRCGRRNETVTGSRLKLPNE